jgi:hemolysin activation/secretion protein
MSWQWPAHWQLSLRLAGQYAREPGVSNEDYSVAGVDGVRGYLEAEVLGDSALKGTIQLRLPLAMRHGSALGDAFVYFDDAVARMLQPLPGEPASTSLRSWGAGMDLLPGRPVSGSLTWARPLLKGSRTLAGDSRVLFTLRGAF